MSTDTQNEIKHLIKQLNQISAQCEQNDYSTKTKCIFLPVPVYQMNYTSYDKTTTVRITIHNKYNKSEMNI